VNPISDAPSGVSDRVNPSPGGSTAVSTGKKTRVSLYNRTRDVVLADEVAIADTFLPRLIGLLGKGPQWATERRGLWIIPSHGVHTLGMKFSIDVVFLDRKRRVVHVENSLRPWRLSKVLSSARSVVELPAATIANSQTQVGDQLEKISG